ncbi:MAG TPA: hypothetical protein PLF63_14090, partial [Rubrivivax sp.]|nr:hypothetical protein [Rubrivivax sp.]
GLGLLPAERATISGAFGDGVNGNRDVDLFRLDMLAGETIRLSGTASNYAYLRVFNAAGEEIGAAYTYPSATGELLNRVVTKAGAYYVGVSGEGNYDYDPNVSGSGTSG